MNTRENNNIQIGQQFYGIIVTTPIDSSDIYKIYFEKGQDQDSDYQISNHLTQLFFAYLQQKEYTYVYHILNIIDQLFDLYQNNLIQNLPVDHMKDLFINKISSPQTKPQIIINLDSQFTEEQAKQFIQHKDKIEDCVQKNIKYGWKQIGNCQRKGRIAAATETIKYSITITDQIYVCETHDILLKELEYCKNNNKQYDLQNRFSDILYYLAYYGNQIYTLIKRHFDERSQYEQSSQIENMNQRYINIMKQICPQINEYYEAKTKILNTCQSYQQFDQKGCLFKDNIYKLYNDIQEINNQQLCNYVYNNISQEYQTILNNIYEKYNEFKKQDEEEERKRREEAQQEEERKRQEKQKHKQEIDELLEQQQRDKKQLEELQKQKQQQQQEQQQQQQQNNTTLLADQATLDTNINQQSYNYGDDNYDYYNNNNILETSKTTSSHTSYTDDQHITSEVKQQRKQRGTGQSHDKQKQNQNNIRVQFKKIQLDDNMDQKQQIHQIATTTNENFQLVGNKLDQIDKRLDQMDKRFDKQQQHLEEQEEIDKELQAFVTSTTTVHKQMLQIIKENNQIPQQEYINLEQQLKKQPK